MPGGLVMAARAGNRMQARQTYRTINRMERRRGFMRDAMTPDQPEPTYAAPPPQQPPPAAYAPAAAEPDYTEELRKLADLHAAGVLDDDEYQAKKRQILGI